MPLNKETKIKLNPKQIYERKYTFMWNFFSKSKLRKKKSLALAKYNESICLSRDIRTSPFFSCSNCSFCLLVTKCLHIILCTFYVSSYIKNILEEFNDESLVVFMLNTHTHIHTQPILQAKMKHSHSTLITIPIQKKKIAHKIVKL